MPTLKGNDPEPDSCSQLNEENKGSENKKRMFGRETSGAISLERAVLGLGGGLEVPHYPQLSEGYKDGPV